MPVVHLTAIPKEQAVLTGFYVCPVYTTGYTHVLDIRMELYTKEQQMQACVEIYVETYVLVETHASVWRHVWRHV